MVKSFTKQLALASALSVTSIASAADHLTLLGADENQEKIEFSNIQNFTVANTNSVPSFTVNKKDGSATENIRLIAIGDFMANAADVSALNESISIFPNPVSEKLKIYGAGDSPMVCITNSKGETVVEKQGTEINVSSLPEGIYWVKVGGLFAKFLKK